MCAAYLGRLRASSSCAAKPCEWTPTGCFPTPSASGCEDFAECFEHSGCSMFDANNFNLTNGASNSNTLALRGNVGPEAADAVVVRRRGRQHTGSLVEEGRIDATFRTVTNTSDGGVRVSVTLIEQSAEELGPFSMADGGLE